MATRSMQSLSDLASLGIDPSMIQRIAGQVQGQGGAGSSRAADAAPSGPPPGLTGPALERYWNGRADEMDTTEQAKGTSLAEEYTAGGNIGLGIQQQQANHVDDANLMRMRGMPDRRAFLASLAGKKVSGLGAPGFELGRIAPGTTDVIEPTSRSYGNDEFDDSAIDPSQPSGFAQGSMAARSGLSVAALKELAKGRGGR